MIPIKLSDGMKGTPCFPFKCGIFLNSPINIVPHRGLPRKKRATAEKAIARHPFTCSFYRLQFLAWLHIIFAFTPRTSGPRTSEPRTSEPPITGPSYDRRGCSISVPSPMAFGENSRQGDAEGDHQIGLPVFMTVAPARVGDRGGCEMGVQGGIGS